MAKLYRKQRMEARQARQVANLSGSAVGKEVTRIGKLIAEKRISRKTGRYMQSGIMVRLAWGTPERQVTQ